MAIRDLLWACPICGREGGIRPAGRVEACVACGARFRRGKGSVIIVEGRDGRTQRKPAAEWAAMLPAGPRPPEGAGEWRRDRVRVRFGLGEEPVYRDGDFLGGVERMSEPGGGELALTDRELVLHLNGGGERRWPLDRLSAVQASSGSLQIKPRGEELVSFRFPEGSARLWEESVSAALRELYRASGRGEILEFQPRIVTR